MAEFEDSPDEWLERRSGEEREEFNIKLENDETVEFSIISDLRQHPAAKIGSGAFYHPRDRRIYLNSNSSGHPLNAGVHEQEHVRQAFLYPGFDQITSDVTETLDNLGLIEVSDCGDFDEVITTMEDINISNTKLGEDLVDLGYSKDSLATLVTSEEDVANSIHELQEYYPEDRGSEGWLENVMELVQTIEDSSPEDGIMRTKENSIDAEKEAFAYFIGEYVEAKNSNYYYNSTLDGINISAPIHHAYDQKIGDLDVTVGEKASERLRELVSIHENLTEYAEMNQDEAVEYIMDTVQSKKVEYQAKQLSDIDSREVSNRLLTE